MTEQEQQNLIAPFVFSIICILVALTLGLQAYIGISSPRFDTASLKSAKIVHITNAYIDKNDELVGMTTERHQASYQTLSDISINKSGNTSVYPIPNSGHFGDDDYAVTKSEMSNMLEHNSKADKHVRKLRSTRNSLIVAIVIALIIWVVLTKPVPTEERG